MVGSAEDAVGVGIVGLVLDLVELSRGGGSPGHPGESPSSALGRSHDLQATAGRGVRWIEHCPPCHRGCRAAFRRVGGAFEPSLEAGVPVVADPHAHPVLEDRGSLERAGDEVGELVTRGLQSQSHRPRLGDAEVEQSTLPAHDEGVAGRVVPGAGPPIRCQAGGVVGIAIELHTQHPSTGDFDSERADLLGVDEPFGGSGGSELCGRGAVGARGRCCGGLGFETKNDRKDGQQENGLESSSIEESKHRRGLRASGGAS